MTSSGPAPPAPTQALLTLRIIGASLGLGVTLFAFVSWFLHLENGAPTGTSAPDPTVMFNAMLLTVVVTSAAAIVWWRTRVAPLIEQRAPDREWFGRFSAIQSNVIIAWALVEAGALFAEIVYYLYDLPTAGVLGVVVIWAAVGLGWPSQSWVDPGR